MTRENANTLASGKGPHADSLVCLVTGRENICTVRVPGDLVNIRVVANHQAKEGDVVLRPNANSFVMAAGGKIMAEWAPAHIPHRSIMSFVHD